MATTTELLDDVASAAVLPSANGLHTPAQILRMADLRMRTTIAALLMRAKSDYWLSSASQSIVAGTSGYRIPDRALMNALVKVTIVEAASGTEFDAPHVPAGDRSMFASGRRLSTRSPFSFSVENGRVILLPTPTQAGYSLKLTFYARPSKLVALTECAVLDFDSVTTSTVTVITTPTPPAVITDALTPLDIVRGDGMYEAWASQLKPLSYVGGLITFTSTVPASSYDQPDLQTTRTDYVCQAGYTPYPPVPDGVYPVLVQATACSVLEAMRDAEGLRQASIILAEKIKEAASMLAPRVDSETERVTPRFSPLRRSR